MLFIFVDEVTTEISSRSSDENEVCVGRFIVYTICVATKNNFHDWIIICKFKIGMKNIQNYIIEIDYTDKWINYMHGLLFDQVLRSKFDLTARTTEIYQYTTPAWNVKIWHVSIYTKLFIVTKIKKYFMTTFLKNQNCDPNLIQNDST